MSKVLIIPDIHLKHWMFDKAEECLNAGNYDNVVCLGDLVDDWDQEKNLNLYEETLNRAIRFAKEHENMLWCYGNHDVSYLWLKLETGYSEFARPIVVSKMNELERCLQGQLRFVHNLDNVIFSHAGLTQEFVDECVSEDITELEDVIDEINSFGKWDLWKDNSPIWARPQNGDYDMYREDLFHVVGHTPVDAPLLTGNVLTLDTFSTYRHGIPIGNQRFVWIDTVRLEWDYAMGK